LTSPPLSYYIKIYVDEKVNSREQNTELKIRNLESIKSFFRIINRTKIIYRHNPINAGLLNSGPIISRIFEKNNLSSDLSKKEFGQLKVSEISYIEINDYIKERLKTVSKISVSRELTFIKKLFDNLKYQDKQFFDLKNPLLDYDKSLLVNRDIKNIYRLSDEDKTKLFNRIDTYQNWEMKAICYLSYYCAFRRSEVVFLEWNQIHLEDNYIQLYQTKSGQPRRVFLTKEAVEVIKSIPKKENQERLFTYKLMGFSGSFDKMLDNLNIKGFRFHFFRREAISNLVFNIGQATGTDGTNYSILISEIFGIENVRVLEKNHLSQLSDDSINSQNGVMKIIGHSSKQNTKRYSHLKIK
jgi:integrase